jgi:STE24 endopeptidase
MLRPNKDAQQKAKKLKGTRIVFRVLRMVLTSIFIFAWIRFSLPNHLWISLIQKLNSYLQVTVYASLFFGFFYLFAGIEDSCLAIIKKGVELFGVSTQRMIVFYLVKNSLYILYSSVALGLFYYFATIEKSFYTNYLNPIANKYSFIQFLVIFIFTLLLITLITLLLVDQVVPEIIRVKFLSISSKKVTAGALYHKINVLAKKVQYEIPVVFVNTSNIVEEDYNANWQSYRNKHKIILGNGLINNLDEDEIIGLIGHELGHGYYRHAFRNLLTIIICELIGLIIISFIAYVLDFPGKQWDILSFGIPALTLFFVLYKALANKILLNPIAQRQEIVADTYSIALGSSADKFANALIFLADKLLLEFSNTWMDWLFFNDHPSTEKRVKLILGKNQKSV